MITNSGLLPQIRDYVKRSGHTMKPFMLFGVRDSADFERDVFNDYLGCVVGESDVYITQGTTEPGIKAMNKPMNAKGTAHLVTGYHEGIYVPGIHGLGKYFEHKAFIQCSPVTVKRYKSMADFEAQKYMIDRGMFGINFHSTIKATPDTIGGWSYGCQVVQMLQHLNMMLDLHALSGHRGAIDYILFDKTEVTL